MLRPEHLRTAPAFLRHSLLGLVFGAAERGSRHFVESAAREYGLLGGGVNQAKMWQKLKNIWEYLGSSPKALAQLAHIGFGGFLTDAAAVWWPFKWAALGVAVFAVLKELSEFWTETDETRGSTIEDCAFWGLGIILAWVLRL